MKPILTVLLTILITTSFAQVDTQIDTIKRNAVFLSYEEFKNNTPSIHPITIFIDKAGTDKFILKYLPDSLSKPQKYREPLWGFSDSVNVYIKYRGHYALFQTIGKVCVFIYFQAEHTSWNYMSMPYSTSMPTRSVTPEKTTTYILDATGNIIKLTVSAVKNILQDDEELLKTFNDESKHDQDRDKYHYLVKYNERHTGK